MSKQFPSPLRRSTRTRRVLKFGPWGMREWIDTVSTMAILPHEVTPNPQQPYSPDIDLSKSPTPVSRFPNLQQPYSPDIDLSKSPTPVSRFPNLQQPYSPDIDLSKSPTPVSRFPNLQQPVSPDIDLSKSPTPSVIKR
ncbi:hypothetical protein RCL1_005754 [Eukaryota sp. TZLM3-RCL]